MESLQSHLRLRIGLHVNDLHVDLEPELSGLSGDPVTDSDRELTSRYEPAVAGPRRRAAHVSAFCCFAILFMVTNVDMDYGLT